MATVVRRDQKTVETSDSDAAGKVQPKSRDKVQGKAQGRVQGRIQGAAGGNKAGGKVAGKGRRGGRNGSGEGGRDRSVVREVESRFDIGAGFTLPDLGGLPGIAGVAAPRELSLDATYFDTTDLRLLTRGVTLRRRTGGSDAGWHLKLPQGAAGNAGDRQEVRLPPGRSARTVPAALAAQVSEYTDGAALAPVARLHTHRVERPVLAPDGRVLAEIAQDEVSAAAPAPDGSQASVSAWSELEIELVDGEQEVLAVIAERVLQAGATPSPAVSRLARALSDQLPQPDPDPAQDPAQGQDPDPGQGDGAVPAASAPRLARLPKGSAGGVVLAHLGEQVARLHASEPLVRADEPDAVHQMRVATRRLRSALASFRPVFDRTVTDPLRAELAWLAEVLGAARDAEVTRDHLRALVAGEPAELVLGPVQARIVTALGTRYRAAHDAVLAALDGARYASLLAGLDGLLSDPALSDAARDKADRVLLPLVAKNWRTMQKLHHTASAPGVDAGDRDVALHELRKAAKRARYAGEALIPRYGKPATKWAARMEALQEILGAHQDTVLIRAQLRELAVAAYLDGENAFTYGRLHALEQARAEVSVRDHAPDWKRAAHPGLHRWLRP